MIQNDFEQLYDDYTNMMLFASSNKHKLESISGELDAIIEGYSELIGEPQNQGSLLNSLNGLKAQLKILQDEVDAALYRYDKANEMLRQIDLMLSDYYKMDIEISTYELNGMEQDLENIKEEYAQFQELKSRMGTINGEMDDKIDSMSLETV